MYGGHPGDNGWAWLISEYADLLALTKMGFRHAVDDYDQETIDKFLLISHKVTEIQRQEQDRGK